MTLNRSNAVAVYAGLVALTGATLGASFVHPGRAGAVALAVLIASVKAWLIAWFYMHLKDEGAGIRWIAVGAVVLLLILIIGLAPDFAWRLR